MHVQVWYGVQMNVPEHVHMEDWKDVRCLPLIGLLYCLKQISADLETLFQQTLQTHMSANPKDGITGTCSHA